MANDGTAIDAGETVQVQFSASGSLVPGNFTVLQTIRHQLRSHWIGAVYEHFTPGTFTGAERLGHPLRRQRRIDSRARTRSIDNVNIADDHDHDHAFPARRATTTRRPIPKMALPSQSPPVP